MNFGSGRHALGRVCLFDFSFFPPGSQPLNPEADHPTAPAGSTTIATSRLTAAIGQSVYAELNRIVTTPGYTDLSLEQRREKLERAIDRGRRKAKKSGPPPGRP